MGIYQAAPSLYTWEGSQAAFIIHRRGADTSSFSRSKMEGALKGWKWYHNMKRMLLPWNFAIGIHVVNLCLYFFGQRDNCTWTLAQETHWIISTPNCNLTQVDFKPYSKEGHHEHQVRAAGWFPAAGHTQNSHVLQFITHNSTFLREVRNSFLPFEKYQKKIEGTVSNLVLTN